MLQTRTSWTFWRSCRRSRTLWVCLHTHTQGTVTISLARTDLSWLMAFQRRVLSVFMSVYIPLQLRSEKEKQTPVIEPISHIPMVPVRPRRSVPVCWCVRMFVYICVCVWVCTRYAVPQPNPSNPWSSCCLHAGVTVPVFPSLQLCYFYPPTWVDVAVCLSVSYWILMLSF